MSFFNDKDEVTINLQELHDMLASANFSFLEDGVDRMAFKIILEDPGNESPEAFELVRKANLILELIQSLDGEFHDLFDGGYC